MWIEYSDDNDRPIKASTPEAVSSNVQPFSILPVWARCGGSMQTSVQISESMDWLLHHGSGNPPLGQDRAWSTENFLPQAQSLRARAGCQL